MNLIVEPGILAKFPKLRIGVVLASNIQNAHRLPDLDSVKRSAVEAFVNKYTVESLREHPNIKAWRETYRQFGVKPKKSMPTAEALLRRLLKGESLPTVNIAVDQYLVVETEYLLPIGGYDIDRVSGDIRLKISPGNEQFVPIGAREPEQTKEGEVVYCDDERILTRKWNFRDSDETKITEESKNIALFVEAALPEAESSDIKGSISLMSEYLAKYCGGTISTKLLTISDTQSFSLQELKSAQVQSEEE